MYEIKQSTAETVPFFVHDSAGDGVTGLTNGSFTKRISKGSGSFGAMTVTITEMENGWYSIPLSATHSDTTGLLSVTFTNAGAKQVNLQWRVETRLVDDLNNFNAASDDVAVVTLVTTTTTNTDMVGTDNAATEAKQDIIDTNIDQIEAAVITNAAGVDVSADIAALKVVADAIPTTAMRGTDGANTTVPDAAGVAPTAAENRAEMDSNSTQLTAIVADTNELQSDDVPGLIAALNDISVSDLLTTQMTEAYAANGIAPTMAQSLFAIHQMLMEFAIAGTAYTVKRLDSSTTAFVVTLDDATNPTGNTR